MHERQFLDTGTMRKGKEWGRAEPVGLPEGGEPEAPLLPPPLLQILSDGEEGLPGSPLSQLDACLLCLPLLLPALQEPGAHQLPRVSGCTSPICLLLRSPSLGQGSTSSMADTLHALPHGTVLIAQ